MTGTSWSERLRDRLRVTDPGRVRLRIGLRSVIAAAVTAEVVSRLAQALGQPSRGALIGVFVAMTCSLLVNDPTPRQQVRTLLVLPLGAMVAVVAAAFVGGAPYHLADVVFLGFVFASVYLRRFGARWTALGMLAFLACYVALYLKIGPAQIGWTALWIVVGAAVAGVVRFFVIRERPDRVVRQLLGDCRAAVALLLDRLVRLARDGQWHRERWIQSSVEQVGDIALMLQDQLEGEAAEPLRTALFEAELAAERTVWAVARVLRTGDAAAADSAATRLRVAVVAIRAKDPVGAAPPPPPSLQALSQLDEALGDLLAALPHQSRLDPLPRKTSLPGLGGGGGGQAQVAPRQALQATIACTLALMIGHALSPTRWQWAVLAAYVVFGRAVTSSDSLVRAWQRTLGTVLGAAVGFAAAELLRGDKGIELVLVFVCIFAGYYMMRTAYAVMVGCITMMLALLYDLMGMFTPGLMMVRLEETLVGAALGAAASLLVLPNPAGRLVRQKLGTTLRACADLVEKTFRHPPGPDAQASAVELKRRLQEARQTARPLTGGILAPLRPDLPTLFYQLSALVFYASQLSSGTWTTGCHPDDDPAEAERAERLARDLRQLAARVEEPERPRWRRPPLALQEERPPTVTHCLERMEQLTADLQAGLPQPTPT